MPATTVKGGKVKGEGRVISINAKYGFLAAQGINSKVFIIPSSLKLEAPFPPLTDELHIDDLVTFEANEQVERNGARYLAVDGSVKLKQRGKDVMVEGEGKIVRLDVIRGCFGFIESPKVGSVFFNISAVRPSTTDVTKILKLGQKVKFRALPNLEQPNCKWRASVVCAFNKASEYLQNNRGPSSPAGASVAGVSVSIGGNASNSVAGSQISSVNAAASNSMSPSSTADGRHRKPANHRSGSADNPSGHRTAIGSVASATAAAKSSSFCSSTCASTENLHTSGVGGVSGATANGVMAPSGLQQAPDVGVIGSGVRATSPPDFLSAPGSSSLMHTCNNNNNTNINNNNSNCIGHVTRGHHDFGAIGTTAATATPPYGGEFSSSATAAVALQSLSPIGSSSINNYNNSYQQQQPHRRQTASSSSYESINNSSSTNNLVSNNSSTNNNMNSNNNLNNGLINNNSNCSSNIINNTAVATNNGQKPAKNCDYVGPSNNFPANNYQQQQIHLHNNYASTISNNNLNNSSNNIHNANTNNSSCNNNGGHHSNSTTGATSSGGGGRLSSWPCSVDPMGVNPAAMWDLYLEQQQKALNQNFNPFAAPSSTEIFPFYHQHQQQHHQNNHHQAALHAATHQQQYYTDNELNNSNKMMANGHAAVAMGAPPIGPGPCPASFDYDQSAALANSATPGGAKSGESSAPPSQQQRHLPPAARGATAASSSSIVAPPIGDDICRHIKRLAHELNGWRSSDECAFCRGEESF